MNWRDILPFLAMSAFFGWLALFWMMAGYGLWCFVRTVVCGI